MSSLFSVKAIFVLILQYFDDDDLFFTDLSQVCQSGQNMMIDLMYLFRERLLLIDLMLPHISQSADSDSISTTTIPDTSNIINKWTVPITWLTEDHIVAHEVAHPDSGWCHLDTIMTPPFPIPRYNPSVSSITETSLHCLREYRSLYYRMKRAVDGLADVFPFSCMTYRHRKSILQQENALYVSPAPAISLKQIPWILRQLLASFVSKGDKQRALSYI